MFDRSSALLGIRHMLPLMFGAAPFGTVLGVAVSESSVPDWAGFLSAPLIFGGAAQLVSITLLGEGAPWASALAAALVVNARHVMYSAALVPHFQRQPTWFRRFGPYLLIDQLFALSVVRDHEPVSWRSYYLGAGSFAWAMWLVFVGVGILAGAVIPETLGLDFAIPIMFVGLVAPALKRWPPVAAVVTAVLVTAATAGVPNRGGILIGGVAGMIAGALAERNTES